MNTVITSETALKAQTALWEAGKTSRVVGWGVAPIVPYENDKWTLERIPKSELESTTPAEVMRRIRIIERVCPIDCILIAHEKKAAAKPPEFPTELVYAVSDVLPVLGEILGALVSFVASAVGLVIGLGMAILMVDPKVIVVLEDGTWLEVATWYD